MTTLSGRVLRRSASRLRRSADEDAVARHDGRVDGTRLVGAGRLCVEVPADWPTRGRGPVTESCVEYAHQIEPAVAWGPPAPGTVCVQPEHVPLWAWAGRRTDRLDRSRGIVRTEDAWSDRRGAVRLDCVEMEASILLTGELALAREVAGTVRGVPRGHTWVPNVFLGVDPPTRTSALVQPDADQARLQLRWARLVPVLRFPDGETDGRVESCEPPPFSVVQEDSEVQVGLYRIEEP